MMRLQLVFSKEAPDPFAAKAPSELGQLILSMPLPGFSFAAGGWKSNMFRTSAAALPSRLNSTATQHSQQSTSTATAPAGTFTGTFTPGATGSGPQSNVSTLMRTSHSDMLSNAMATNATKSTNAKLSPSYSSSIRSVLKSSPSMPSSVIAGLSPNAVESDNARTQKKVNITTPSQQGNDTAEAERKRMRDKFSWQHVGENTDTSHMLASRPGAFQFETRVSSYKYCLLTSN